MRYPYIEARRHGGPQSTHDLKRIVMHSTVSPCTDDYVRIIAEMFHTSSRAASAHYVVGPSKIIKCLHDGTIGYHAPPNAGSIGIEQCDWSRGNQWGGAAHTAMLHTSARLAAAKAKAYNVPVTWLSVADLKAGRRGITSHNNVSLAFHQSTHTDPDGFPVSAWMKLVRKYYDGDGDQSPPPPAAAGEHPYPGRLLRRGSTGKAVEQVQAELNRRAVTAAKLKVDGDFGPATERRVKGFQGNHGLKRDGVVGPNTWKALFG